MGSPPLARGTVKTAIALKAQGGITPACAGNSLRIAFSCTSERDHPRLRGEQFSNAVKRSRLAGSPPLARGTAPYPKMRQYPLRITPACAGNSGGKQAAHICHWDHPRLRGEQLHTATHISLSMGSPPLARGTGPKRIHRPLDFRITPACAGNSLGLKRRDYALKDHPRLRGEQRGVRSAMATCRGSPPLARGTATDVDWNIQI